MKNSNQSSLSIKPMKFLFPALLLNLAAAAVLTFSGNGAVLQIDQQGDARLSRKSIFGTSSERFRWSEVRGVRMVGVVGSATSTGRQRGAAGENLQLELVSGKKIEVHSRPVAWPLGDLKRNLLVENVGKPFQGEWRSVSLGGASWFIAFVLAGIGGVLTLMKIVVPITGRMPADQLKTARWKNLWRFGILVILSASGWLVFAWSLIFYLIGGLAFV